MTAFRFFVKVFALKAMLVGVPYADYVWLFLQLSELKQ